MYGFSDSWHTLVIDFGAEERLQRAAQEQTIGTEIVTLTVDGFRQRYIEESDLHFLENDPRWQRLKAVFRPGDVLVKFNSSEASWAALAGRAGYAVVRDGQAVDSYLTRLS
jgi:hypothetical protein